jgi:toxin ParE1/3/4
MAELRFSKKAIDNLSHIWNYTTTRWSQDQADRYYSMLIESCREIADNPDLGKEYSQITENLFGFKAGRHIIFYSKD